MFEPHVIRTTEAGTTYEDTVDHLSESEREVTGLVFALAGYLAHEVYEEFPFILLNSLEAIDSERIAALVEYLTDYTKYLLVELPRRRVPANIIFRSFRKVQDLSIIIPIYGI